MTGCGCPGCRWPDHYYYSTPYEYDDGSTPAPSFPEVTAMPVDKVISPKVYVPLAVNVAIGLGLVLLGERELGVGMLVAAATGAGFGYAAPPRSGGSINP